MRKLILQTSDYDVNSLSEVEKENNPEEVSKLFTALSYRDKSSSHTLYPRASSLYKCCIRQNVLCHKYNIDFNEHITTSLRIIFEIGNSFHYWIQNTPGILGYNRRGIWRCQSCGRKTIFGPPPQENCSNCGASHNAFVYHEYEVSMITPFYLKGHPDMFVERPKGNFRIMEFKSINSKDFNQLQAPIMDHIWQLHAYFLACFHDSFNLGVTIDKDVGYIMYISKGYEMRNFPIRTFVVKRDKTIMAEIKNKLEAFKNGIDYDKIPAPLDQCVASRFQSIVARSCPVAKTCERIK
jgi:rubrerythrin